MADFPIRRRLAPISIRVGGAWILAGALLKLFKGTPADLPAPVRDFLPNMDLTFWGAIAAETFAGVLALLHPRAAWPLLSLVLLLFIGILGKLIAAGAASCGCFGPTIKFPPELMLAIDGVCLAEILWARPWSSIPRRGGGAAAALASLAIGLAAPWIVIGPPPLARPGRIAALADPGAASRPAPRWVTFEPKQWIGKPIRETALADWMRTDDYPGDAVWILYRINCPHCAEHLRRIKMEQDRTQDFGTMVVLVRLPEDGDEKEKVVDMLPETPFQATLPAVTRYVIQTPWELRLEGGIVRDATQHLYEGKR
ncbi:MAG TPA: hypothetical protein VFI25_12010 [Planctomycetota bacterium]|jgi:hypothetical protein|nr:hypothetical protein [Planctomycetota bacterium]